MKILESMGLSAEQSAAVLDPSPQVLVSAGAGSGKTRVLVAAALRALLEEGLPAERLIAVTFTRKAGAELASRVRAVLEEQGRPDLSRSLDSAVLGTIDALCRRLVKDHALEAGVDPVCAVLEPEAADILKDEVMLQAWEKVTETCEERELEALAAEGRDLCGVVVSLYDRLRGLGQDEPQIAITCGRSEPEARSALARSIEKALAVGGSRKTSVTLQSDLSKLSECLLWLLDVPSEREIDAGLSASSAFFPSRRLRDMEDVFAPVRAALIDYRCALAEIRLKPLAAAVNTLLAEFHHGYVERKHEQGLVDFADLELKARGLLPGAGKVGPRSTPFPGALLLVDEFQDTNELQCAILDGLGASRVLMVGDEQQSIYRFRGAEVEVFRRQREARRSRAPKASDAGLHHLRVNYRSHPHILDFINRLFAHESFFGISHVPLLVAPGTVELGGGLRSRAENAPRSVEVLVAERRAENDQEDRLVPMQQAEAEAVAGRVRRLIDDEEWRQRDIVILLPSQTRVECYQEALKAQRIDAYLVRGKGYYAQEEVTDVCCLLRLLVDPHDDLALISVLRSPLAGLSDDGLYLLGSRRRSTGARTLWDVVTAGGGEVLEEADRAALGKFLEDLGGLRPRVGRPGLARLIDDAISTFAYDLCVLGAPDGPRRFANLRKLMRLAEEFERVTGPDLAGLVSVLESRGRRSDREGNAPTLAEGEDVVRVMTVHQAKGLEFPVVVLAGLGSDFHRPERRMFMVGNDGRVGLFLRGYRRMGYEPHDPCWGPAVEIADQEAESEREEDTRLLYVAMTRAQERLVLVGARPEKEGSKQASRIGRILAALEVSDLPPGGERITIQGLPAEVVGVERQAGKLAHGGGRADVESLSGAEVGNGETEALQGVRSDAPGTGEHAPAGKRLPGGRGLMWVSFSTLAAYRACPRQFYLERVLGLVLDRRESGEEGYPEGGPREEVLDQDERGAGRDVGILVHRLLERLLPEEVRPPMDSLGEAAEKAVLELGLQLGPPDMERALHLCAAAWISPVAENLRHPSVLREAPFAFAHGDAVVSGVMDAVRMDGDCWQVVDYKTNALGGRSVSELAEAYSLQAEVYCLAALRAGAEAVRMDLVFLERPEEPATARYGGEDLQLLEGSLDSALSGLRLREYPASLGPACARCAVAGVCQGMIGT